MNRRTTNAVKALHKALQSEKGEGYLNEEDWYPSIRKMNKLLFKQSFILNDFENRESTNTR